MNKILGIQVCRRNFPVKTADQPCIPGTTKGFMDSSTEFRMYLIPKDRDSGFSYDAWTLKTVAIIEVCGNVKINQAKREKFVSAGRKKNIIKKKQF
jgi:hypothetical protein